MRYVSVLVIGLVLLAIGAQGGIRLLIDNSDPGLLAWVPGGSVIQLVSYATITVVGILLAAWGRDRARERGHLN